MPQLPARRGRSTAAAQPVRAAFFGVGAPEAILVGVVALVVFGPKGLAQVGYCSTAARLAREQLIQPWRRARGGSRNAFSGPGARGRWWWCGGRGSAVGRRRLNSRCAHRRLPTRALPNLQAAKSLGSTLRSFAPTIRELTSVSQELKSTLEQVRLRPGPGRVALGSGVRGWGVGVLKGLRWFCFGGPCVWTAGQESMLERASCPVGMQAVPGAVPVDPAYPAAVCCCCCISVVLGTQAFHILNHSAFLLGLCAPAPPPAGDWHQ